MNPIQMLARLLPLIQKGVFHTAEGISKAFVGTPKTLGNAFRGVGSLSRTGASKAFRGLEHGVYHTAEGISKAFTNPKQSFTQARGAFRRWRDFSNWAPAGLKKHAMPAVGAYRRWRDFSNWGPNGPAAKKVGGLFGSAVGRGARAVGAGAAGVAGMGMAGAGAVGGMTAAPFKAVGALFTKMGASSGPVGKSIALFTKLAGPSAIVGVLFGLKKFVGALSESNRDLAKWNGSIAASFNKLDLAQMRLDIQTANATSGTASSLNDAFGELLKEFQPIREDIAIAVNVLGIEAAKATKTLLVIAKDLAATFPFLKGMQDHLEELEREAKKGKDQTPVGNLALNDLAAMRGGQLRPNVEPVAPAGPMRDFLDPPRETLRERRLRLRREMGGG